MIGVQWHPEAFAGAPMFAAFVEPPAPIVLRRGRMSVTSAGNVEALWARTVFSPVPVRNAFEVTVERLAQGIRLGVLVDGDRLPPERELAETFGVSRMTLREAIKALREAKLVESRRGRGGGTFVVRADPGSEPVAGKARQPRSRKDSTTRSRFAASSSRAPPRWRPPAR